METVIHNIQAVLELNCDMDLLAGIWDLLASLQNLSYRKDHMIVIV